MIRDSHSGVAEDSSHLDMMLCCWLSSSRCIERSCCLNFHSKVVQDK